MKEFLLLITLFYVQLSQGCDQISPLGLESGAIPDDKIYCLPGTTSCSSIRPGDGFPWYRSRDLHRQYVTIDLGDVKNVTQLEMFKVDSYFVEGFKIYYSIDNRIWSAFDPIPSSLYTPTEQRVEIPDTDSQMYDFIQNGQLGIKARFVTINPTSWVGIWPGMKLELHGCPSTAPNSATITGIIQNDETWSLANGPYLISEDTTIDTGVTITVEPGVHIAVAEGASLTIKGSLIARGEIEKKILISSDKMPLDETSLKWRGFVVSQGAELNMEFAEVYRGESCIAGSAEDIRISHTSFIQCSTGVDISSGSVNPNVISISDIHFSQGTTGLSVSGSIDQPHVTVRGITARSQATRGILIQSNNVIFKGSELNIAKSNRHGIRVWTTVNSSITITNSTITENQGTGLFVDPSQQRGSVRLNITNSVFQRNGNGLSSTVWYQTEDGEWLFEGNLFEDNFYAGLRFQFYSRVTPDQRLVVRKNTFNRNGDGSYGCGLCFDSYYQLTGNYEISSNMFNENTEGLRINTPNYTPNLRVQVSNNDISKTVGPVAVTLDIDHIEFNDNTVINSTNKAVVLRNIFPRIFTRNTFSNPDSSFEIEMFTPFDDQMTVNLSYNFWGSSDPDFVATRIQTFFENVDIALANIYPFYIDSKYSAVYEGNISNQFSIDNKDSAGGKLEGNVTIPDNSQLIISRSIWIPSGTHLFIGSNSTLMFMENRGIYAQGGLVMLGKENGVIQLTNWSSQAWAGIRLKETGATLSRVSLHGADIYLKLDAFNQDVTVILDQVKAEGGRSVIDTYCHTHCDIQIRGCEFNNIIQTIDIGLWKMATVNLNLQSSSLTEIAENGIHFKPFYDGIDNKSVNITLVDSTFAVNDRAVFLVDQRYSSTVYVFVSGCSFRGSRFYAVKLDAWMEQFLIEDSKYVSNENDVQVIFRKSCKDKVYVRNNYFASTERQEIYIDTERSKVAFNCAVHITGNQFHSSYMGSRPFERTLEFNTEGFTAAHITGNVFFGGKEFSLGVGIYEFLTSLDVTRNYFSNGKGAVSFLHDQSSDTLVKFDSNRFQNYSGNAIVKLETRSNTMPPILFMNNRLEENGQSNSSVIELYTTSVVIYNNHFNNPKSQYNVRFASAAIKGFESVTLNLTSNDWQSSDIELIGKRLYDRKDDPGLPLFNILPLGPSTTDGTQLSGTINDIRILTADKSPYRANETVDVTSSGLLVIEAGVTITFDALQGLRIGGQLIVRGSTENPVKLVPTNLANPWHGVTFYGSEDRRYSRLENMHVNRTAEGIVVRTSRVEMENVTSDYSDFDGFTFSWAKSPSNVLIRGIKARYNSFAGVYIPTEAGQITIQSCELQYNIQQGLASRGSADIFLLDCVISNSETGILSESRLFGEFNLNRCEIYDNSRFALQALSSKGSGPVVYAVHNSFVHSHPTDLVDIQVNSGIFKTSIDFVNNVVSKNLFGIALLNIDSAQSGELMLDIRNNNFTLNGSPILLCDLGNSRDVLNFEANLVKESSAATSIVHIIGDKSSNKTLYVRSNTFEANLGFNAIWFQLDKGASSALLSNNIFVNNSVSSAFSSGTPAVTLDDNVFSNPEAKCELNLPPFNPTYLISAKRCYWGSADIQYIVDRMCGFDKKFTFSRIDYIPFRTSENTNSLIPEKESSFTIGGMYGGTIENGQSVRITESYNITRSIFVEDAGVLSIEPGVELRFAPDIGIYTRGKIQIGELESEPARMTAMNSSWSGLVVGFSMEREGKSTVRLVDGPNFWSGRLEYATEGEFGTVCDKGFDKNDAMVACRELGYSSIDAVEFGSAYIDGLGKGRIALSGLNCLGTERSLSECQSDLNPGNQCSHEQDISLTCLGTQETPITSQDPAIYNTVIEDAEDGVTISSLKISLKKVKITRSKKSGIVLNAPHKILDLGGSIISNSGSHGVLVKTGSSVGLSNFSIIDNKGSGVFANPEIGHVTISNVQGINNQRSAVDIRFENTVYPYPQGAHVTKSIFENHTNSDAIYIATYSNIGPSQVIVEENVFRNNPVSSVRTSMLSINNGNGSSDLKTMRLSNNEFYDSGPSFIWVFDMTNVSVENNRFRNGIAELECLLRVKTSLNDRQKTFPKTVSIDGNDIQFTKGLCTLELDSNDNDPFQGKLTANNISNNVVTDAAVILKSPSYRITNNTFINKASNLEFKVEIEVPPNSLDNGQLFANGNFWEFSDAENIKTRIYDGEEDSKLYTLVIEDLTRKSTPVTSTTITSPTTTSPHTTPTTTSPPTTPTTTSPRTTPTTTSPRTTQTTSPRTPPTTTSPRTTPTTTSPPTTQTTSPRTTPTTTSPPTTQTTTPPPTTQTTSPRTTPTTTSPPTTKKTTSPPTTQTTTSPRTTQTTSPPTTQTTTPLSTTQKTTSPPTTQTITPTPPAQTTIRIANESSPTSNVSNITTPSSSPITVNIPTTEGLTSGCPPHHTIVLSCLFMLNTVCRFF